MDVTVPLHSTEEERTLMGTHEARARAIRNRFGVGLAVRRGRVHVEGEEEEAVSDAVRLVRALLQHLRTEGKLEDEAFQRLLDGDGAGAIDEHDGGRRGGPLPPGVSWKTPSGSSVMKAVMSAASWSESRRLGMRVSGQ